MNSWSLLHNYMNETHDDAPWLDCMDGLKLKTNEEILEKAAESVSQILKISHHNIDKTKFVYFYTLLYNQLGGDDKNMKHWLNTYNTHLEFCPADELVYKMPEIIGYLESFL